MAEIPSSAPLAAGNKSIESIAGFALDALCIGGGGGVFGRLRLRMVRKEKWSLKMENHLLDRMGVCRMFGGSKPINAATLYRWIRQGVLPKPVKIGGSSRWLLSECQAALQAMVDGRQS